MNTTVTTLVQEQVTEAVAHLSDLRTELAEKEVALALALPEEARTAKRARDAAALAVTRAERTLAQRRMVVEGLQRRLEAAQSREEAERRRAAEKARREAYERVATWLPAALAQCEKLAETMAKIHGERVIDRRYYPPALRQLELDTGLAWLAKTVREFGDA